MTKKIIYYLGLVLTTLGMIGLISEIEPLWATYSITGLGITILFSYISRQPNTKRPWRKKNPFS